MAKLIKLGTYESGGCQNREASGEKERQLHL